MFTNYKNLNVGEKRMKLADIKGEYNQIFSLGENCIPALKLRKFNLRQQAGPFDWVGTPNLFKIIILFQSNFADFLKEENLEPLQYVNEDDILVHDKLYNIGFNHDFKKDVNTLEHLGSLPQVQEKYQKRINRFMEALSASPNLLFIRTEATLEGATELNNELSQLVKNSYRLLIVNHAPVKEIIEQDWGISNVCVLELPNDEIWDGNDHLWQSIFEGITLVK